MFLSLLALCLAAPASTIPQRHPPASPWQQAVDARTHLESLAPEARTRIEYKRVTDRFRAIYHDNPRDPHAAEAVYTVAELLAEQGRDLDSPKSLQAAVAQYEYLRTQYPASPLRAPALLAEARIDANDLHDPAAARDRYTLILKLFPHTAAAKEASAALTPHPRPEPPRPVAATHPDPQPTPTQRVSSHTELLAQVTGIRHWSTSTYTRVAIDLSDEATFEAARVPNPDRIFFDLHGAHLAQDLINKSFTVTDDGFLERIRTAQAPGDVTRIVLDVHQVTDYSAFLLPNPYRLIIDIHGAKPAETKEMQPQVAASPVSPTAVRRASAAANTSGLPAMPITDGGAAVRPMQPPLAPAEAVTPYVATPGATREVAAVSEQPGRVNATTAPTTRPIAATVPTNTTLSRHIRTDAAPAKPAEKTADGETSLIRALGLHVGRIVIDPGHGGHDSGTIGAQAIEEKDVVLDVALRLGKLLHERLGTEIIYTRSDDTYIPLETRTAIANKAQADLFLSIHANSSPDASARGVETYYLNFTSDENALDVAARENALSGQSIHQLSDLVKKIALKDKIAESREFANDVEGSLYAGLQKGNAGLKNRGVKKAPFVVLIGANMPSILAEISFVTNPQDASELRTPEYRQRVAESLYAGVAKYESSLSGGKAPPPPVNRASVK